MDMLGNPGEALAVLIPSIERELTGFASCFAIMCLVLVEVTRQQADQNRKILAIVRQEMDSHFDELRLSMERTQNLSREVKEFRAFVELIRDIAGQTKLQDVMRQRVEQVEQALVELTAHTRLMITKISEDAWDGIFALPLKERLDQQLNHYVMNSR